MVSAISETRLCPVRRLRGEGAGSGAAFERTLWLAVEWRGGQEVWWHAFETEAEALDAVGLPQ